MAEREEIIQKLKRASEKYDKEIKGIQMRRAMAIHDVMFNVDEPIIATKDIDSILSCCQSCIPKKDSPFNSHSD